MKEIVFFVGLPGSGKTTIAKERYPEYTLIDDFDYHWRNDKEDLIRLMQGDRIVITDPTACKYTKENIRKFLTSITDNFELTVIAIDTPVDVCIERVKMRDDRVISDHYIRQLYTLYNPNIYDERI